MISSENSNRNNHNRHRGVARVPTSVTCTLLLVLVSFLAHATPAAALIRRSSESCSAARPGIIESHDENINENDASAADDASAAAANTDDPDPSYKKQRGTLLEEPFDEHDLLRAYREIQSEYREKAFGGGASSSSADWKVLATLNPNKKSKWNGNGSSSSSSSHENDDEEVIKVSMLEHPSDPLCPYVKMETVLPIPVEHCWNFLSLDRWDETMPKMDPFYEGLDIYGEYEVRDDDGDNDNDNDNDNEKHATSGESAGGPIPGVVRMILARKRTKRILAFGKREFVFVSVEDTPLEDGTWVSGTVSVETRESSESGGNDYDNYNYNDKDNDKDKDNDSLPSLRRNKAYTRAFQDSIAFYKPLPSIDGNGDGDSDRPCRTKLTIVCRIDLNDSNEEYGSGGCIPMWLYVKTIGVTGARSVCTMRQCLLAEYKHEYKHKHKHEHEQEQEHNPR